MLYSPWLVFLLEISTVESLDPSPMFFIGYRKFSLLGWQEDQIGGETNKFSGLQIEETSPTSRAMSLR
jgi:hypothetical protein